MDKKTISVTDLSKCLGIGMNAAYTLVRRDDFPKVKVGKRILISISGLEKWLENETANHTTFT